MSKAIDIVYIDREGGYKDSPYRAFYKGVYVDDFMTAPSYKEVVATYGQVHYQVVCSFCNSVEEVPEGSTVVCFNCNNELTDTGEEL